MRGAPDALIDVQWSTPHLASLGVIEIPRADVPGAALARRRVPAPSSRRRPGATALDGRGQIHPIR